MATLLFDEQDSTWARETAPALIELPEIQPLQIVPGPAMSARPWTASPTLVVGLGGAGRLALKALRKAIAATSPTAELPSTLKTLLVDSNPQSISRATSDAGGEVPLSSDEVVCCPLRKPQDYRDKSDRLLKWMSRRWLYNIPRSLRTEGIRPLGRLAFVDHARQVMQRVRMSVEQLLAATGAPTEDAPLRIYFVGSISGGSASGMLNDLAYATRAMLKHLELPAAELIAVTAHSPSRRSELMELSRVNSFAWLTELAHWSHPDHRYPGDDTAGIPAVEAPRGPFDHVYVLDLGDRVDDRQFTQAAQDIADYLLLDATSPAGTWIKGCRQPASASTARSGALALRTFAVRRSAEVDQPMVERFANQLLRLWASQQPGDEPCVPFAGESAAPESPTTVAQFAALARGIVEDELGGNAVGYLGQRMRAAGITPATLSLAGARSLMDQIIPVSSEGGPTAGLINGKRLQDLAAKVEAELATKASQWLQCLVTGPDGQPPQILRQADAASECLASVGDQLQAQVESTWQGLQTTGDDVPLGKSIDNVVVTLWRQRLHWVLSRLALHLCEAQSKCVEIMAQDVDSLHQCCQQAMATEEETAEVDPHLLRTIDERLRALVAAQGGFHGLWNETGSILTLQQRIGDLLPSIIRSVAVAADGGEQGAAGPGDPWQLRSLGPNLRFQGGECSQLIVGPDPESVTKDYAAGNYVQVPGLTRAYTIFEAGGLSPLHVAATFVSGRRDYADMAGRVHTRRDINWRPLLSDSDGAEAEKTPPAFPFLVHDTQALCGDAIASTAAVSECHTF